MPVIRKESKTNFTIIPKEIIENAMLSSTAKTILIFALSRPADWTFSIPGICRFTKEGSTAIRNALDELESQNYLFRHQRREKGRFERVEYFFFEDPSLKEMYFANHPQMAESGRSEVASAERGGDFCSPP